MRCFVALWPPAEVRAELAALERPQVPGVRWCREDQWHVTLSFLGAVDRDTVGVIAEALGRAAARVPGPQRASLGPTTATLGRGVLCVAVAGLDDLAAAVRHALAEGGSGADEAPFRGHLTLARGRRDVPRALVGTPFSASWAPRDLCLVASSLRPSGAIYETLVRIPLEPGS